MGKSEKAAENSNNTHFKETKIHSIVQVKHILRDCQLILMSIPFPYSNCNHTRERIVCILAQTIYAEWSAPFPKACTANC